MMRKAMVGAAPRGRPERGLNQRTGCPHEGAPTHEFQQELESLRQKHLLRKLRTLTSLSSTRALWEGRELLLFCGNDYLGLSHHPRVIAAAQEALNQCGAGAGAARLISGTSGLHTQLEGALAQFKRKEAALVFGSGYLTNLGVLSALAGKDDLIVMDKLSHASLIDGAKLSGATVRIFPHKNYKRCTEILDGWSRDGFQTRPTRRKILVSDSVFSMDGDLADLFEWIRIKEKYECLLVIDDAHGIGVLGNEGRGATEGLEDRIDVIVGTLSKALGVFGGFVCASQTLIEYLINFARPFLFATAPPPALCAAALEALHLIREDISLRQKLWDNVNRIREFLEGRSEATSPIFPIVIGEESRAVQISEVLLEKGLLIPAVRYPTVARGKARLRLTVSAAHTEEDLEKLFRALEEVLR